MKIFTQTYDLAKASPHRFWVAPFSEFKIGIKILEKDEISSKDFTLKAGSIEFTPDEDKIDNFTLYTIKSNDTGFVDYTIEVEGVAEKLKLMQIVTDSTVFEIDAGGGGDVPADVATQTWVNSQISDFVEEDALTAYATKDELTAYAETDDLTAYYTKSETSSATEIGTALEGKQPTGDYALTSQIPTVNDGTLTILQGGVEKGTFTANQSGNVSVELDAGGGDMSNYYTKSETEQVAVLKQAPSKATIVKYADGTLSSLNLQGSINHSTIPNKESVVEACVGTDVTEIGQQTFYNVAALTSVVIPDTVKKIGPYAFSQTALCGELSLPEGLEDIATSGFGATQIKVLHLPSTIKNVGVQAFGMNNFRGNYLSSIIIENGATGFQANAFYAVSADVVFKGKTLAEVQAMENYPWGLVQTNRISAELTPTQVWAQANFATNNDLATKVDHFAGGMAPEVMQIATYYSSEYSQLSVDDPTWEPDPSTMYVILPDPD